ncbi:MAG: fimbrillin family protein [Bacteroidales bacterium]|nr:fimbrillin family protein [Bacteroidales bacterium]
MKKTLLIAAAALVAFAACTKSEIDSANFSQELSFAPNALNTKALILPDGNSPEELAFPTGEAFNVFAFADLADGDGVHYGTPLMNDVEISFHSTTTGGDWKATTGTYLWPATGTVDFFAYYPGTLTAAYDSISSPKGITLTGVSLGTIVGSQIDPLTAGTLAQQSSLKKTVPMVFKHITSQIAACAYDATETSSLQGKISIKKVVFKSLNTTGDYTEGTTTGAGEWTNVNGLNDFTIFQGSEVLDTTENYLSAGSFAAAIDNSAAFVVIPGGISNGVQTIEVTYAIAAYTINGFDYPATPAKTVSIPLYNRVSGNTFQNGKRYVFHLGISLDGANNEIMFAPTVLGWTNEDISGITIDAINSIDGSNAILLD